MTEIQTCTSVTHRSGDLIPRAKVAVIYHDSGTQGGTIDYDPDTIQPGAYGTETAFLCEACAISAEVSGSVPSTLIRVIALE